MFLERTIFENVWEVDPGLYRILLPLPWNVPFVNVYLIESRGEYALIDCGLNWNTSLRALGRGLKAVGVPPLGLRWIILTHGHSDHAGATGPVQERWGGTALIHPADERIGPPPADAFREWALRNGMEDQLSELVRAAMEDREDIAAEEMRLLSTSEPIEVGDLRLSPLFAPGHSPGHVMLREERRDWLFLSDLTLPAPALNVWLQPGESHDPLGDYLESLERFAGLSARVVVPGHGAPSRGSIGPAVEGMARYHQQYAGRVLALVTEQRRMAWELVQAMTPSVADDPDGARVTLMGVLAALAYHERRGRVRQGADGRWEAGIMRKQ